MYFICLCIYFINMCLYSCYPSFAVMMALNSLFLCQAKGVSSEAPLPSQPGWVGSPEQDGFRGSAPKPP